MADLTGKKRAARTSLAAMLEEFGLDGLIYELTQIVVAKRNEADEGNNKAEKKYWQDAVEMMGDFQARAEEING